MAAGPQAPVVNPLPQWRAAARPLENLVNLGRITPDPNFQFRVDHHDVGPFAPPFAVEKSPYMVLEIGHWEYWAPCPDPVENDQRMFVLTQEGTKELVRLMIAPGSRRGCENVSKSIGRIPIAFGLPRSPRIAASMLRSAARTTRSFNPGHRWRTGCPGRSRLSIP